MEISAAFLPTPKLRKCHFKPQKVQIHDRLWPMEALGTDPSIIPDITRIPLGFFLGPLSAVKEVDGFHTHYHFEVLIHYFDEGMDNTAIRLGA